MDFGIYQARENPSNFSKCSIYLNLKFQNPNKASILLIKFIVPF